MPKPIVLPEGVLGGQAALDALLPMGWRTPKRKKRIAEVNAMGPDDLLDGERWGWNPKYRVKPVANVAEHDQNMGYEIADKVADELEDGNEVLVILPVGPTGQYEFVIERFAERGLHPELFKSLTTINMDEWTDKYGNVVDLGESFEQAMYRVLFGGMEELGYNWRTNSYFAKPDVIVLYREIIEDRRRRAEARGKKLVIVLVHGIGYVTHIAFVEAHMAAMFPRKSAWLKQDFILGMPLCPLTLLQNAITSFFSDLLGPSPYANTIGPGIYLQADYVIGGCDGALMQHPDQGFTMSWQAQTVHMTLGWGVKDDLWVPSSMIPQRLRGSLHVVDALLEPLKAESH